METTIGATIKHCRKKQGLTQVELGQEIWGNISYNAAQARIKRIEAGLKEPTQPEEEKIEQVLGHCIAEAQTAQLPVELKEYDYIRKIYPEIEAWIKMLYYSQSADGPANPDLALAAWHGLKAMSKQKIKILRSMLAKERNVG